MAKKTKKQVQPGRPAKETVAKAGLGALLLGVITWAIGPTTRDNAVEWVKIILFAVTVALLIRWPIIEPFKIPSGSMEPTLHGDNRLFRGDRVFVNKWLYGVRYPFMNKRIWHGQAPERWDIVVFKNPEPNAQHGTLVKRIVGMPGERIQIANGRVYADGKPLELKPGMPDIYYTSSGMFGVLPDPAHAVVPEGNYLVLGDNSGNSRDGRFFGWLPNENILGRVASIWWPPTRWRDFTGFTGTWWWKTLLAALAAWVVVRLFFGRSWHVRRGVDAKLAPGEHVFVNRAAFGVPVPFTRTRVSRGREARRGEVVVYRPPSSPDHDLIAGRVAGLPGEQVYLDNGRLTVNGEPVASPADLAALQLAPGDGAAPYGRSKSKEYSVVPGGHYFIIAENGAETLDSRTLGWIPREDVVGPVSAVWWPPRRWRRVRP